MPPASVLAPSAQRSVVLHVATAAGLVMGMVAQAQLIGGASTPWLAASLATALMVRLTMVIITRPSREPVGIDRTLGWSMVMGMATTPVAFLAASLVSNLEPAILPMALVATVVGAHLGLVFGLVFGLLLSVPVVSLTRAQRHPSADATDGLVLGIGLWLAVVAVVCGLAHYPLVEPFFSMRGRGTSLDLPVFGWFASLCIGVGCMLAVAAARRRLVRRRWVAAVARGRVPGWRVVPAPDLRQGLDTLPCLGASLPACQHLLHRCEDPGPGAYRQASTSWPVAWVPRAWIPTALRAPRESARSH